MKTHLKVPDGQHQTTPNRKILKNAMPVRLPLTHSTRPFHLFNWARTTVTLCILATQLAGAGCVVTLPNLPTITFQTTKPDQSTNNENKKTKETNTPTLPIPGIELTATIYRGSEKLPADKAHEQNGLTIVPSQPYVAATGKTCRQLLVSKNTVEAGTTKQLICKDNNRWYLIPPVVQQD